LVWGKTYKGFEGGWKDELHPVMKSNMVGGWGKGEGNLSIFKAPGGGRLERDAQSGLPLFQRSILSPSFRSDLR